MTKLGEEGLVVNHLPVGYSSRTSAGLRYWWMRLRRATQRTSQKRLMLRRLNLRTSPAHGITAVMWVPVASSRGNSCHHRYNASGFDHAGWFEALPWFDLVEHESKGEYKQ